jgi:exocyst complex protein 7
MISAGFLMLSPCRSEAKDMLGDDWVQRQRRVVQQHATGYRRAAWTKVSTWNSHHETLHACLIKN